MPKFWRVIGGADKGGILVRDGQALASTAAKARLSTGAEVEEVRLVNDRLQFRRHSGTGPTEGWISTKVSGKALVEGPFDALSEATPFEEAKIDGVEADEKPRETSSGEEPTWIKQSRDKMKAFHEGAKVLPPDLSSVPVPVRLSKGHPTEALPAFKRLTPKQMEEMSPQSLPGHFSSAKFPHNTEQLKAFGPDWYTQAFHKFGTLPKDNRVTKIVSVKQLPHSGFDAAGGAGHKAFIDVEYAKPDPNLHTKLFAKFPWDYFESETGKTYRMQISSTGGDMDAYELLTYMCCEHLFPFRIPKLYFCDINRDTTNYILITERIPFGRRGRIENNRLVEKIDRKPFEVLPVCGKYQDYLLEDPAKIYYAIFREMAHLAAWDQQGHFDSFFGPKDKFDEEKFLEMFPRKPMKQKMGDIKTKSCALLIDKGIDFAVNVAPQVFPARCKDPKMLEKLKADISEIAKHFDDVRRYLANSSDYVAAMHMNLQADNAYFWPDERGALDVGIFDWCGFSRVPFVMNFMGCLSGADCDILDGHEEGLMRLFCDEYERYGGPHLDVDELLLRYRLIWPSFVMDACQWVERDIYRELPKEEWHKVKSTTDSLFVDRWNVRCRGTTLINALDFWSRRPFKKIFDEWKAGKGKRYVTEYSL